MDAMERHMSTTLATKPDLTVLRQEMRQDLQLLKQELENRHVLLDQKIDTLQLRMTVRLGSMLFVGFGLMIATLRLWA